MSAAEANELADVMGRVKSWPPALRIALAHRILDSLEPAQPAPRALSARSVQELIGLGSGDSSPPDDEAVRRWIDEHRMGKHG
jgi:hypothetical protein